MKQVRFNDVVQVKYINDEYIDVDLEPKTETNTLVIRKYVKYLVYFIGIILLVMMFKD